MGDVKVVKKKDGGYDVILKEETISLPPNSSLRTVGRGNTGYGTETTYIEVVQGGEVNVVDGTSKRMIADDEEGTELAEQLAIAWSDPEESGGRRRSRLNRKARRTKRNRRNTKGRKLRKLSTRRR